MISVNNLSVYFGGECLFENVTFNINERDRVGLVGKNGAGKTTLLRILSRELVPETGIVVMPNGSTTGYLHQELTSGFSGSVFYEAMQAFKEPLFLKSEIERLTNEISLRQDVHSDEYLKLISRLNDVTERFAITGGHTMEAETEKVLLGLGFIPEEFSRSLNQFSGGWQMRVELAKILLAKPDLILLDEPTNHLDIESIQWLEEFLSDYPGAVIVVSHDRAFLDNVTKRTIEITFGKIYDYRHSYSGYIKIREELRQQQQSAFENQQQQIAQIERFVERFRYKATKSRQVQSKIKMLEKMERVAIDEADNSAIRFTFPPAPHSGRVVVDAMHLCKSFENKNILHNLEFSILSGEAVAFVGKNGEGKTTLSKMINGLLNYEGTLTIGHNVKIGYYAQNQADMLNPEKTVYETIDDVAVGDIRPKIRNILGSFLFGGDTIDKKVKVLSGGEKSRLALAQLLLTPVNLLILDEPTNHLDMPSKDILKNALLQYEGTLIIVSHDRDFLQGLTTRVFEFKNKNVKQYLGDIYDFLQARKLETLKQLEQNSRLKKDVEEVSDNKQNWEKKKQQEREIRKIQNQVNKVEEEIEKIEKEISHMDQMLSQPDQHADAINNADFFARYEQLKKQLSLEMQRWEELHLQLEQ